MADVLVAYLYAPGEEYEKAASRFFQSLQEHSAGMPYDLLTVVKEGVTEATVAQAEAGLSTVVEHGGQGLDIQALLTVAKEECDDYDWLVWFGSWSRILHDDWLLKLHRQATVPDVGAVAATGSWESGVSFETPNPHLRTTGLMINPRRLHGFSDVYDRRGCYEFEHGVSSLTRTLKARRYECLVVGADGQAFREHEWPVSATYRQGNQANLLIADKQTDAFMAADHAQQRVLAGMAGWEP